jgi:hypothetical protein
VEIQKSPAASVGPFLWVKSAFSCPFSGNSERGALQRTYFSTPFLMAHKLTKQLRKGLTLVAGKLPETTEAFREKVTGEQLLAEGKLVLDSGKDSGKAIKKGYLYGRAAQRPVNHGRRLCAAYEAQGRAGVLAYCTPYIEPADLALFSAKLSELVPA